MAAISLRDQVEVAESLSVFQRLLMLDQVWTNHLQSMQSPSDEDRPILRSLVDQMDKLLVRSESDIRSMHQVISEGLETIDQAYAAIQADDGIPAEQRNLIQAYVERHGGAGHLLRRH